MKITVIGCGRWGTLIAWYLHSQNMEVTLYGRASSHKMQQLQTERKNEFLTLPDSFRLTTDLQSIKEAQIIVISVNSQGLQALLDELKPLELKDKLFVLCMKGIEIKTGRRLTQVINDNVDFSNEAAVWIGPGHVQELYRGIPNCMVIDSTSEQVKTMLVNTFNSDLIRIYYGQDLIGNEIGAAAKNVIGIAAGMLDGLGLSSLKGALISRGTREVSRLIKAMGGNELSAYGLCHLGDYEATVFSPYSNNRRFGELFIKGEKYEKLAEGYYTVKAMMNLGKNYGVELPISKAVYDVLYNQKEAKSTLDELFRRTIKPEF
ncbi:MAG: NAD(P)H-dependent glycerol-3-phosphate dehydrogenase [Lachnospiraceae bacterium]|nr:NAD(P)H-dependent glycerol-3-phosphate dehydrogenase [Lachnospiraceae bacterium]